MSMEYETTKRAVMLFTRAAEQMIESGFKGVDSRGRILTRETAVDSIREGTRLLQAADAAAIYLGTATSGDIARFVKPSRARRR